VLQSGGTHLVHEFLRAASIQIASQHPANVGRLDVELFDQAAQVVAVARKPWLQHGVIVESSQNRTLRPIEDFCAGISQGSKSVCEWFGKPNVIVVEGDMLPT
jgi:hypothetical protein